MWYVIQVYTGQEEKIVCQCREKVTEEGEEAFIPLVERMRKIHGEWMPVKARLFPGYVFIKTDKPHDLCMRLKKIKSMAKLLTTGEEITPLYREEEEYLQGLQDEEHVIRYSEGYLEGDKLIINEGSLKGYEGRIKKVLRHKRLVVLEVSLLGRKVEITLGLGVVEKR